MSQIIMALPPPLLWQQFEMLTKDVAHFRFNDPGAKNYGNQGATQNGVDVYCRQDSSGDLIGIQCKRRGQLNASGQAIPGGLTVKDLASAVKEALKFTPSLDRFILATTDTRQTDIQDEAIRLDAIQKQSNGFSVEVMFWDEFVSELHKHAKLLQWYYRNILELKGVYNPDHQILYLLHIAFSRPAFKIPLNQEESGPHLNDALKDTETALNTGQLKDRESKGTIRSAPGGITLIENSVWRSYAEDALRYVEQARMEYKKMKDSGQIIEVSKGVVARSLFSLS